MLDFCTGVLYCLNVQINRCKRCNRDWCFRGAGHALRCGKCGSPYWDREARNVGNAGVDRKAEKGVGGGRGTEGSTLSDVREAEKPEKRLPAMHSMRNQLAGGRPSGPRPEKLSDAEVDSATERSGSAVDSEHEVEKPFCRSCEGFLTQLRGKWVCMDPSCGKYGMEVKNAQ